MRAQLMLMGVIVCLSPVVNAWGLGDLKAAAQTVSGGSACKACGKSINNGDLCLQHQNYKPCKGGCGKLVDPNPPFGGPYCPQCQASQDSKAAAERVEKKLRDLYRDRVDVALMKECNAELGACDLKAMAACVDETQDGYRMTVKEYADRIQSDLSTLGGCCPKGKSKTYPVVKAKAPRAVKGEGVRNLISVGENNGVYQVTAVSEDEFVASWKGVNGVPGDVNFDTQTIRSIVEHLKHAKDLLAMIEKQRNEIARQKAAENARLDEAKALVGDESKKFAISGDETAHPRLFKDLCAGMSREWVLAWARVNGQLLDREVMKIDGMKVDFIFRNDVLVGVTLHLSAAVTPAALIQKYKPLVGGNARVNQKREDPAYDMSQIPGKVFVFECRNIVEILGCALRVNFAYREFAGVMHLLDTTVNDFEKLKLWDEAGAQRKARAWMQWKNNPGDMLVDTEGKVSFNSRDAKKLLKEEKDILVKLWAERIESFKEGRGVVGVVTITGVAAESECKHLESVRKRKELNLKEEKRKADESAALNF